MTVSTFTLPTKYTGSGTTGPFATVFRFLDNSHLVVKKKTIATGATTTLAINTDYTVTGAGNPGGGNVTLTASISASYQLIIDLAVPFTQQTDYTPNDPFPAESHEAALDKLTMLARQVDKKSDLAIKFPSDETNLTSTLPAAVDRANKAVIFDASGNVDVSTDDYEDQAVNAAASAAAALASENNAAASEVAAALSETNAAASEVAAAASAAAAAATLSSALWRDVVFITNADSPYTINSTHNGKLISCDTSSGNISITMPQISSITPPFNIGVKKTTSDGNTVTMNRSGTDTIDGSTSKTLVSSNSGTTLVADTDPAPDRWTSADFGLIGGNFTVDRFSGTGAQTAFTLSVDPGSENNTYVYVSGVYQQKDTYSVSGTTLTFSAAPPLGTDNVEIISGTTLSIGTPADGTVSTVKIADDATTNAKLANMAQATIKGRQSGGGTGDPEDLTAAQVKTIIGTASESDTGVVELATTAEATTGTDTARAVTPAGVASHLQSKNLTLDTQKASTSGTEVDFTDIPSWAKRITIMFDQVGTNGTSDFLIRIGDSGGIETTGYVSIASYTYHASPTATVTDAGGFVVRYSTAATFVITGIITLVLMDPSTNKWVCSHTTGHGTAASGSGHGSGVKSLSATLDRIRITTVSGNTFDSGSINIMYE